MEMVWVHGRSRITLIAPISSMAVPRILQKDMAEVYIRCSVQKRSDGLEGKTPCVWPAQDRLCRVTDEELA